MPIKTLNQRPNHILIVEDDPDLGAMLKLNLEVEGFTVDWVMSGEECLAVYSVGSINLVILDLMLPGMGGLEVLRTLRRRSDRVPVIILTAKSNQDDRVSGLAFGSDDYLTKPFALVELTARIRAVMRRSAPEIEGRRIIRSGPYKIDFLHLEVYRGRTDLSLSSREFRLLEVLVSRPGYVFSRQDLLNLAWDADAHPTLRTVDKHIQVLRRKLGDSDDNPVIHTVDREGYRWVLPVKR